MGVPKEDWREASEGNSYVIIISKNKIIFLKNNRMGLDDCSRKRF